MYRPEYSDISFLKSIPKKPDFDGLLKILHKGRSDRPRLFEFFLNETLYNAFADEADFKDIADPYLRFCVRNASAYKNAGYDYMVLGGQGFGYPRKENPHSDRSYSLNEVVTITDRDSFEAYAFPDPSSDDFYKVYDDIVPYLPDGMKAVGQQPGGLLENVIALCGYDSLCLNMYDDPDLVSDIFKTIGSSLIAYTQRVVSHESVGAMIINDDWGFNTQTMLSHADMRLYVLPYISDMIAACHNAGKPAILHSCGNLGSGRDSLYEDIITAGLDAKHSFEDVICPIEQVYETYKGRLALMGGIDVNYICTNTPEAVYCRSLAMLDMSASDGGWALGTGNSVPYYVPSENYTAMIAAALVR
jgi:uroporphyrinogen decarboxylase